MMSLRIKEVQHDRTEYRTQSGTSAQRNALPECNTKITHGKPESEPAYSPEYSEENRHADIEHVACGKEFEQ